MAHDTIVPVPAATPSLSAQTRRARVTRAGRFALGSLYIAYFVYSYRAHGFPFDRDRILLWIAAALLISGIGLGWRRMARVAVDWIPFAALFYAYDYSYGAARKLGRPVRVEPLVRIDRFLFGGHVPAVWLQQHIPHAGPVGWWELGVSVVYATHFVLPFLTAGVLWWKSRKLWRRWVGRLMTASFAAVVIYAVTPTGAPWYAALEGKIPPIDRPVGRGWTKIGLVAAPALLQRGRAFTNPYAALPSLHACYSMLLAVFVYQIAGHGRWRWLAFTYPAAMAFVLLYGGEHFVIDILAGWALALVASWGCDRLARRCATRTAAKSPATSDNRRVQQALEPADHIGRQEEAEPLEDRRRKTGTEPLVADDHDLPVVRGRRNAVRRRGVQAPLQHVAIDDEGTRQAAVALALLPGADVHDQRPLPVSLEVLVGADADQTGSRLAQHLIDHVRDGTQRAAGCRSSQSETIDELRSDYFPEPARAAKLQRVEPDPGIDELVDVRGLGCAGVLIELARLARTCAAPRSLAVWTDDAGAPEELPSWCRLTGHTYVGRLPDAEQVARHHLVLQQKGAR